MTTILTGLRTNSSYHIGNYVGAISPMLKIQKELNSNDKLYLFLPDLHSLQTDNNQTNLENSLINARLFLASGITTDGAQSFIYRQSRIPAHSQLQWILNWYTYMGEASRMTQYKDKSKTAGESIPVSLFTYPILQAADILLYDAQYIPVGEDQKQHLELTRDIAFRFNHKHGDTFTVPQTWDKQLEFSGRTEGARVRSLTDPTKKMSKSDTNPNSCIMLSDTPEIATKKIMSAATDSIGMIDWNWDTQPGITNLLQLLTLFSEQTQQDVTAQWQGNTRYGDLKKSVAETISSFLSDLQEKISTISLEDVENMLKQNEDIVTHQANNKLHLVYQKLGLL